MLKTFLITFLLFVSGKCKNPVRIECSTTLRMGQYICPDPDYNLIDPNTQQIRKCQKNNKAEVRCVTVEEIQCTETNKSTFFKEMPCKWTNGYYFDTALLLSIFFGMFGLDRFYLGYPAIGLAKLCTLGFMFLGQLVDIILISTQVVGPADGSAYITPYYGPTVQVLKQNNFTYRLKQDNW